jgi:hypothetical protein
MDFNVQGYRQDSWKSSCLNTLAIDCHAFGIKKVHIRANQRPSAVLLFSPVTNVHGSPV